MRAMISTMHGGLCVHSEPFRTPGTITHHLLRREPRRVPRVFGVTAAARARSVRSHRHTARARVWFLGFCGASVKSPQQFIEPSLSTSSLGTCLRDPSFPPSRRHGRRAKYGTRHTRDTAPSRYRRVSRCPRVFGSRGVTQLHVLCFIRIRAVRGIHPGRERRIQPPFAWTRFRGHSCDPGVHHDIRVSHGVPGTRARRGGPSRSPQRASPPPQRGDPTRRLRTRQLRMPPGHLCSVRYRAWRAAARVTRRGTHRRGDTTTASQT